MDLTGILGKIKENYSPRKDVDFKKAGLHFEIEPLNGSEEMMVTEGCKDIDDSQYIDTLKKWTIFL